MTSIGQNAAAGVGNAGMQTGAGVSDLLQQGARRSLARRSPAAARSRASTAR
jgi:hypothetical protein